MEGFAPSQVTFGIIDGRMEARVRSKNVSIDVNNFCKQLFGKESAGGKYGSGGAKISFGYWDFSNDPDEIREKFVEAVKVKIMYMIAEQVKGNV